MALLLSCPAAAFSQGWENIEWSSMSKLYAKQVFILDGTLLGTDQYEPEPYPLQGANIKMTCLGDTTLMDGSTVSEEGYFWVYISSRSRLKDTRIHIEISYLGMEGMDTIIQPEATREDGQDYYNIQFDTIVLHSQPITLAEAEIVAELQRMYQRGDTTIFNVGAYEMPSGSVLLDLVRRMPGLKYQNGTLTYLDRSIEEIRLNGDQYFKRDMSIALNNMPTDKLKSLKVYEVPDDTLNIRSDNHLIMDMETNDPMNRTLYANAELGTTEKLDHHILGLNASDWKKGRGEIYGNVYSQDIPDSWSPTLENRNTNGNFYLSKDFKDSKVKFLFLNGGYNSSGNHNRNSTLSKTFMPDYTQQQESLSDTYSGSRSWNSNMCLSGNSEHTHWNLNADISSSHSSNSSQSVDSISNEGQGAIRSSRQEDNTESDSHRLGLNFNYNRSFGKDDRNSLGIFGNFGHNEGESVSDDCNENRFHQFGDSTRTIRHRTLSPNKGNTLGSGLRYDRMVSENTSLGLSYDFGLNSSERSSTYHDILDQDILIHVDSLDHSTSSRSLHNFVDFNFWHSDSVFRADAYVRLRSNITSLDETQGYMSDSVEQKTLDWSFNGSIHYKPWKWLQLGANYDGASQTPSASQLTETVDYSDPMNISSGNSSLKKSFTHTLGLEMQLKSWLRVTGDFTVERNSISTLIIMDRETGARRTSPENINGNWSSTQSVFMAAPFSDLSLSFNASHNFRHNVSYVQSFQDSKPSVSSTDYHSLNTGISAGYSDKNWLISSEAGYSLEKNRSDYMNADNGGQCIAASLRLEYNWDFGLEANTDCNLSKPFGYELESANRTECIWNMSLGYGFLKEKKARISLEWHDILKSYNGFHAMVSGTGWVEQRNYGETSMIILRFSYRFNNFN